MFLAKFNLKVVWAGLPGQESGNSLVDVLYGDYNPTGRLPYTIAKDINDYPAQRTLGGEADDIISIPYKEGLFIDYRHFDAVSLFVSAREKALIPGVDIPTEKHHSSI